MDGWSEQIAIQPVLIGCLDYGLSFENERHQTGFILQIHRLPNPSGFIAIGPAFGDIPQEQLRLAQWATGNIIAD